MATMFFTMSKSSFVSFDCQCHFLKSLSLSPSLSNRKKLRISIFNFRSELLFRDSDTTDCETSDRNYIRNNSSLSTPKPLITQQYFQRYVHFLNAPRIKYYIEFQHPKHREFNSSLIIATTELNTYFLGDQKMSIQIHIGLMDYLTTY